MKRFLVGIFILGSLSAFADTNLKDLNFDTEYPELERGLRYHPAGDLDYSGLKFNGDNNWIRYGVGFYEIITNDPSCEPEMISMEFSNANTTTEIDKDSLYHATALFISNNGIHPKLPRTKLKRSGNSVLVPYSGDVMNFLIEGPYASWGGGTRYTDLNIVLNGCDLDGIQSTVNVDTLLYQLASPYVLRIAFRKLPSQD